MRPALVIGIGLAIFQQVTGINTVIYYAPRNRASAGISSASGAILATAGIGVVNVIMTIVSMWLMDHVGRRPLLLTGIGGMIQPRRPGFRLPQPTGGALAWLAVVTLMVYVASFAISLGPIFWLLIAEIYPFKIRGFAEGTAAAANWTANLVVSLTFLTLVQILGPRERSGYTGYWPSLPGSFRTIWSPKPRAARSKRSSESFTAKPRLRRRTARRARSCPAVNTQTPSCEISLQSRARNMLA